MQGAKRGSRLSRNGHRPAARTVVTADARATVPRGIRRAYPTRPPKPRRIGRRGAKGSRRTSADSIVENPWHHDALSSLVWEGAWGRPAGFLGVLSLEHLL